MDNLMLIRRAIAPKENSLSGNMPLSFNARRMPLKSLVREGKCEQRNLPSGYTQLEYVSNASSTYVNTGITPTTDDVELYIRCTAVTGSFYIMQSRNSSSSSWGLSGSSTGNTITLNVAGTRICQSAISRVAGNIIVIRGTLKSGVATLYVKDETAGTEDTKTGSYTWSNFPTAIGVFGTTTAHYINSGCKCYEAYIKVGGEYVANYTPAKKSSAVGFYDSVSDSHKTATVGSLTAGSAVTPTPDRPMDIWCNNGALKARHQSGLPLGYQKVDYIESTGTQYIDTGIIINSSNYKKEAILGYWYGNNGIRSNGVALGSMVSGKRNAFIQNNYSAEPSIWRIGFGTQPSASSPYQVTPAAQGGKSTVILKQDNNTLYYGNSEDSLSSVACDYNDTLTGYSEHVFCINYSGEARYFAGLKMYSYKLWTNNELVCDMIPAKNSSNVIGMYDLVSGQFFTNQGTDTFTAGAVVSDPVEIYTDGTAETINVHGKNLFNKDSITSGYYYDANGNYTPSTSAGLSDLIPVLSNAQYTITTILASGSITGANIRVNYFDDSKTWLSQVSSQQTTTAKNYTITTPNNAKYMRISASSTGKYSIDYNSIQVEQGSTATTYENYFNGGTVTAEMLLNVGNYQDAQSIIGGIVARKVGVDVLDGTEDWVSFNSTQNVYTINIPDAKGQSDWSVRGAWCSHFLYWVSETTPTTTNTSPNTMWFNASKDLRVKLATDVATTVQGLKAWLTSQYAAGDPVMIVYPLATETTEQVQGQALNSAAGGNTISSTANVQSPQATVKYFK